ncbi:MAG: Uma2 family endonuclease [Polyangiaceae bacterium]|nr:Uma2 family endonuclease [Polyangiaceae bacterium]
MPETNRHMELRTALYQILKREFEHRATLGSDQFVYYDPTTAKKKLAPDAFVKLGPPHTPFRVWKTWHDGAPDVAVEVVSDSDEPEENWGAKLERYRACGVGEVVRFDPDSDDRPIRVWDHLDGDLVEREVPSDSCFECTALGLYWVVVPHPTLGKMLRVARDREGKKLLPTDREAELAEQQAKEAERQAKEAERQAKEAERQAKEAERQAKEAEMALRTRAETEIVELKKQLAAALSRAGHPAPTRRSKRKSTQK